ncbi:MAG: hypothetical protein P9X22_01000, partial [Candidatus Zapsychrus exili]|nr:hypothetical protein [Candidatus Zapsychrus exili]
KESKTVLKPLPKNNRNKGTSLNIKRSKTPKPAAKPQMSMEHTLAFLDADGYIPGDHFSVARFRSLLHQLSSTYNADKDRIGNATVAIQNQLKKKGIHVTLLNILEGMNRIYTTGKANQTYEECGAAYIILRDKGHSHRETINTLKAFLNR